MDQLSGMGMRAVGRTLLDQRKVFGDMDDAIATAGFVNESLDLQGKTKQGRIGVVQGAAIMSEVRRRIFRSYCHLH